MPSSSSDGEILVLGAGAVSAEYYVPALEMLGVTARTVFADGSARALRTFKERHSGVRTLHADFRDALRTSPERGTRVVIVALPNWLHEEAAREALRVGLHVFCEKPLALSAAACGRLAAEAEHAGRVLGVNMVGRWSPSVRALCKAIQDGLPGRLQSIDIEDGGPYVWLSESGAFFAKENGGVLADIGVHYLDLVEEIVGPLEPVRYEDDWRGGVEANALMEMTSKDQVRIRLELSRTRRLRNTALFGGMAGILSLEKGNLAHCSWLRAGDTESRKLAPEEPFLGRDWPARLEACFAQAIREFLLAVGSGRRPFATADRAASTSSLIEWAYRQRENQPSKRTRVERAHRLGGSHLMVTGGTGFVGSTLVQAAFGEGAAEVVVPVRNYKTCAEVARFPVRMPLIDLLQYEQVRAAITGARWVFHCAYGREGRRAAEVTVQGTRNVVEAAIDARCEAVVVLSTVAVFGYPRDAVVDETWPYRPGMGDYGAAKAKMERWCLDRAASSGPTRIVVLNPSCVYGPRGKTYSALPVEMASKGSFCWVEEGRGLANYTFVDNVVEAMVKAALSEQAHGQRFIINDGAATWREFLTPLIGPAANALPSLPRSALAGVQRRSFKDLLRRIPGLVGARHRLARAVPQTQRAMNRVLSSLETDRRGIPPLWLADIFGETSTTFSSEKARTVLGWAPSIGLEEGQRRTVEWLRRARLR